MHKKENRLRRNKKFRTRIRRLSVYRLLVHRSSRHIYAQILSVDGKRIVVSASTGEKNLKKDLCYSGNKKAARIIGKKIALRARKKNIRNVYFDRSGFRYHGRIKALANSARRFGLLF